jgi:hypothetical protein
MTAQRWFHWRLAAGVTQAACPPALPHLSQLLGYPDMLTPHMVLTGCSGQRQQPDVVHLQSTQPCQKAQALNVDTQQKQPVQD